jgi:putative phosphoribosyl transferase
MFIDRWDAGRRLASELRGLAAAHPVVLGLPRGGVPVAYEVATALRAPLDVVVVRKLGVPFQPELAMGAVGEDRVRVLNYDVIRNAGVTPDELATVERQARFEVERRARSLRRGADPLSIRHRTVILVDDGIATGATTRAAIQVARARGASRVVLAVPVAPIEALTWARDVADDVVCLETPDPFFAVGAWYRDFRPVSDDEVVELIGAAEKRAPLHRSGRTDSTGHCRDDDVRIAAGSRTLEGHLTVPDGAAGLVVFVHGSGSSRHSPRNRYIAESLHARCLGTLLFDLLDSDEALDRANVFNVPLLAARLAAATDWSRGQRECAGLPIGWFGASTGAAAALWAAAEPDAEVAAIVSRGGRPDLAFERLSAVRAPTLLVVGGYDDVVLALNEESSRRLTCDHELRVVPRATHLFEEPGALEKVAELAGSWFGRHLTRQLDLRGAGV